MSTRNLRRPALALPAILFALLLAACQGPAPVPPPPATEKRPVTETLHGVEITDDYRWLEDQQAPETRAWIDEQNAYTDGLLGSLPGRDALSARLGELFKTERYGTPAKRGGRVVFSRRGAEQDLFVIYVRENGEDRVLLDPNGWTEDHSRSASVVDLSPDGRLLLYAVREGGQDEVVYQLFDVDAGEDLAERLDKSRYFGGQFTPDGKGLFYTRYDEKGSRVFYHQLGTDTSKDRLVFGEGYGPDRLIYAVLSNDGRQLLLHVLHGSAGPTELHVLDRRSGRVIAAISDVDARSFGEIIDGRLLVHTDWQAPTGRIVTADVRRPQKENWREIVPAREAAVIESMTTAGGRVFVNYLEQVHSRLRSYDLEGASLGEIDFPGIGTIGAVSGRWEDDEAFFTFQSFHIPSTIYSYDVASGERTVWARSAVPVDEEAYEVEQVWYASKDGTKVPMFLVGRKGLERDGRRPVLLRGYGGFAVSMQPRFSPSTIPWLDAGGLLAVANLRGGGEFGEQWHRAGMLDKKQNTFDDFIAAAEYLIAEGYTSREKIAVAGGSNGGLLVGALMTQRPELVRAVVCSYPLLDMVRYHKFLVARFWVPEYGSAEDPEQFQTIYAYSPYHHVEPGTQYPALLMITGDGDTRVAPLHGRKMVAKVQAANVSPHPILLRYHTKAGHSGGRPVSQQIDDAVDTLSFLAWQLGVEL